MCNRVHRGGGGGGQNSLGNHAGGKRIVSLPHNYIRQNDKSKGKSYHDILIYINRSLNDHLQSIARAIFKNKLAFTSSANAEA